MQRVSQNIIMDVIILLSILDPGKVKDGSNFVSMPISISAFKGNIKDKEYNMWYLWFANRRFSVCPNLLMHNLESKSYGGIQVLGHTLSVPSFLPIYTNPICPL